jgi:hypothetical protein
VGIICGLMFGGGWGGPYRRARVLCCSFAFILPPVYGWRIRRSYITLMFFIC